MKYLYFTAVFIILSSCGDNISNDKEINTTDESMYYFGNTGHRYKLYQFAGIGVVPDEEAARIVALAYLKVLYGASINENIPINGTEYPQIKINYEQEYDSWLCHVWFFEPGTALGTVYNIRISKKDGRMMGALAEK
ncbi:MAG: hypothetical protein FWD47_05680 [Treponema sp.]|nr:hypothetical protein [Treponema sp.]